MNAMTDFDSPEDYQGGCAGLITQTSINGMVIENNNINHVGEGMHIECSGPCWPNAYTTVNLVVQYNDFNQVHRIPWEQQPQATSGVVFQYNSIHDWMNPYFGSFGVSFACCGQSATSPYLNVSNNVIVMNSTPNYRYGYGSEDWGLNATYDHNWIGTGNFNNGAPAMAWGYGNVISMSYNTVCGNGFVVGGFIVTEFGTVAPPHTDGNVKSQNCSVVTSVAPSITPSPGPQSFPLTVTVTDPGYTSGAQPLGNTGVWYTTDGSDPVPGSGTAQYLSSGGTFVLASAATVKAVGMWGAANQPASYAAGYGFVPSSEVTAAFTGAGGAKRPAHAASSASSFGGSTGSLAADAAAETPAGAAGASLQSVAVEPSQPAVSIGSTLQLKAIATFNDGTVKDVTADFDWQSSNMRAMTASGSGALAAIASGQATISGSYRGLKASVPANSSIGEIVWNDPIVITAAGTYSGNWQSTDAKIPAVVVATTDPVVIENAHIRGPGSLITTKVPGTMLTVRNSVGMALNAGVMGQQNGNFVEVSSPARLDVENNYVENARGGVIVHGYGGNRDGDQTIVIRGNRARNQNGLLSDGSGGYLPAAEGTSKTPAHFIQLDSVQSVPRIEVGWNEVINYPGQSLVDANIDLYRSSGTPNQPLEIHDSYIQGAYPYRAQDAYAGGGIETRSAPADAAQEAPAFSSIHHNQVIGTANYGIKFAAGHDNIASNNRVLSSGLLADGTRIAAQDVGLANGDAGRAAASDGMYNNTMRDNFVGWACWQSSCAQEGYRKDQFFPAAPADYSANSVVNSPRITLDMEENEYQLWREKLAAAGIAVGPSF